MQNYLTAKEVKTLLAARPDDALVVLARDAAGNVFSPANSSTPVARYVEGQRPWEQGFLYTPGDPEFEAEQGRIAVVLWPAH
jgi:hypothetical protein